MKKIVVIILAILLIVIGMPIAFVIGFSGISLFLLADNALIAFPQRLVAGMNSFPLVAIPMFILVGELMNVGGVTRRIFDFATALVGHLHGGLAHANVMASMLFAGMSGAAVSDTAGLGTVEIKAMKERGYSPEFSAAVTASSSTIGPIIPPSTNLIIYGSIASVSVGGLFLGGIIPGILMGISLMVLVYILAVKNDFPREERVSAHTLWASFKQAFFPLLTPVIILGAILLGITTTTEAAVIAIIYALFLGAVVYREIKWADLYEIFVRTAVLTGSIMLIIAISAPLGFILSKEQIPQQLAQLILGISDNTYIILLLIVALLLFLGTFMEATAIMIVLLPILIPTLAAVDVDLIHFGVVMAVALTIGLITPPVGIALFLVSDIAKAPFERVVSATLPFLVPLIIVLLLITLVPQIVTFLPTIMISS